MRSRRGFALITVLLMSIVMLLMVLSIIALAKLESFQAKGHHDRMASRYLAEAGLAEARQRLAADPTWQEGFQERVSPFKRGVYDLKFHTTGGSVSSDESVNNLTGSGQVPGPFGPVPPHTALLQVTGIVGGQSQTVSALVSRRFTLPPNTPMSASGVINLAGKVGVDGLAGLDGEVVEAGLHSFSKQAGGPTVHWKANKSGDRAVVSGKVSAAAHGDVIDFGNDTSAYSVVGGFETDATVQRPSQIDVAALVHAASGATAPTITSGTNTIGAGTWHRSGDLEIQGDLVLEDGAALYVSGSLKVNGAIRGQGAVYVKDYTTLQGDAFVESSNRVALLSGKDVSLTGFNGNEFIRSLGADAVAHLDNVNSTVKTMTDLIDTAPAISILGNVGPLDLLKHQIAARPTDAVLTAGMQNNQLGRLIEIVESQPSSLTRDFVLEQMKEYHEFFYWQPDQDWETEATAFIANPSVHQAYALQAVFDIGAVFYQDPDAVVHQVRYVVSNLGYDRLGSSFFQGLVYSNGDIRADNGVTVIGAMVADGKNGSRGDIKLNNGVTVTLVESFFEGDEPLEFNGPLGVDSWFVR